MTWRSISTKKTQARSNLRKRRSHCLVTHFGLRHAQKSTTFKAPIHCYIKHMHIRIFHLKVYYPTTNHTTSNLIGTTLIRTTSTEKNRGTKKKNTPVTLRKLRDQGSELAPKTLWGLDLSHFLLPSRNPIEESKVTFLLQNPYQDVQASNIQSFTLRQLDAVVET